jgi:hypothetical protein
MTAHHTRRAATAFAAVLVAGMTFGAPAASAASHPHMPVANHVVLPKEQVHEVYRFVAPQSLEAPAHMDTLFAGLHEE